jgi:hypothetical protein
LVLILLLPSSHGSEKQGQGDGVETVAFALGPIKETDRLCRSEGILRLASGGSLRVESVTAQLFWQTEQELQGKLDSMAQG